MICDICKIDKLVSDFINKENICYKCMYRIKIAKFSEKRATKTLYCRFCNNQIVQNENEKKKQRTVFCSHECAEQGHKDQLNNHWTKKIGHLGDSPYGRPVPYRSDTQNGRSHL